MVTMRAVVLAGGAALAAAGALDAQVDKSPLILIERGASDSFGPGLTALEETKVEFRLSRPGHVVLLWVGTGGQVDLYWPQRSRDRSERRAGRHAISVGDVKSPIEPPTISGAPASAQPGRFAPLGSGTIAGRKADSGTVGYWVLIVADVPITAADVRLALTPMSRAGGGEAVLERLPEVLVIWRAGLWALYAAPVAH